MILACIAIGCGISLIGVMLVLLFMFLGDFFLKSDKHRGEADRLTAGQGYKYLNETLH